MIKLKSQDQIEKMKVAGRITAGALAAACETIRPGATPLQTDAAVRKYIESHGAKPSFLGYGGFPASACISVNDTVIHGIPDHTHYNEGDIVSVDVGAYIGGWHGDAARTFFCGKVSEQAERLVKTAKDAFYAGMAKAIPGNRLGDVCAAVQEVVESEGFSVVREYVGHGLGINLHEDPDVPNYGRAGRGVRLCEGMVIAIEPMINSGKAEVKVLSDEWTVKTIDGGLSAHYENTVAITKDGPVIMTLSGNPEFDAI